MHLIIQAISFTDALRSIQEDASFANRTKLAKLNGIDNYTGSQRQNDELLRLLKEGKIKDIKKSLDSFFISSS